MRWQDLVNGQMLNNKQPCTWRVADRVARRDDSLACAAAAL